MKKKKNRKLTPMTLKALKALQNAAAKTAKEHRRLGLPLIVSEKRPLKRTPTPALSGFETKLK